MSIQYFSNEKVFKLDTPNTSYMMAIVDEEQFLGHVYYGPKVSDFNLNHLMRIDESPFVPSRLARERMSFYDSFPMEYPSYGVGDYRDTAIEVLTKSGHRSSAFFYKSHTIYKGKPALTGMPATFANEEDVDTLEIVCIDPVLNLEVTLIYSAFKNIDAITKSVQVTNRATEAITLTKVLSSSLQLENTEEFDVMTLHGSWARERHIDRRKISHGKQKTSSIRGESGHQDHPFMGILSKGANEEYGMVYGIHFVYSGNFMAQVELSQFDTIRALMGINYEGFSWNLNAGETFVAPEVVHVFSNEGIGRMTRTYHDLYRNHLIRSKYKDTKRPILINNWEATYFEFTTEKLLSIAEEASKLGIEMLVMDDGWFGERNSDNCALGDWVVNEKKLPGGLKKLVDGVNALGMKFGIWFEPEMISPNSDLYRAHPDWAIQIPGRQPGMSREQFVLDISREDVRDYVWQSLKNILDSANIEYVKWDMNRQLTDLGSSKLPANQQGEVFHRFTLGMYALQEKLISEYPNLLLENCSGGGARFDPGMLYYSPQIWCSDDTDAIERLKIQQGSAMIYPLSAMGAHVSDCPNHSVGRVTPFETRGYVALAGTFGYELDVTKIPEEDRRMIPEQIALYHKYNDLVRLGDYYRIASYYENHEFDAWMVIAKDKKEALLTFIQVMGRPNYHSRRLKIKGLHPDYQYKIEETNEVYSGSALMNAGINIGPVWGDFKGQLFHIVKVD